MAQARERERERAEGTTTSVKQEERALFNFGRIKK